VTADALLTQRGLVPYLRVHGAHYLFTVKANQKTLLADLEMLFARRGEPAFQEQCKLVHGRLERRSVWVSTAANAYLNFPGVGQAYLIERERLCKKTGRRSTELAYGITSHTPETADAQRVLTLNRGHWVIENSCHYVLDWNWDEDRSTIRTGYGPENTSRLRRFAIGVIHSNTHGNATTCDSIAATIRRLHRNVRLVFDFLRMTENSQRWARRVLLPRTN
jgi:predicted transposase YbfD/YdcC